MVSAAPQGGINVHLPYIGSCDMIGFKKRIEPCNGEGKAQFCRETARRLKNKFAGNIVGRHTECIATHLFFLKSINSSRRQRITLTLRKFLVKGNDTP